MILDPRQLSFLLDEIVLMSQSAELFDKFIRNKAKIAMETNPNAVATPENSKKKNDGLLHISELNRRMQELIGNYITLEEFYMAESVRKAIRMDEIVEDSMTSSVVDHVFFVFQQCTRRSLLCTNINAVCAVINIVVSVVNRDFLDSLQKLIQDQFNKFNGPTILNRSTAQESKISINVS